MKKNHWIILFFITLLLVVGVVLILNSSNSSTELTTTNLSLTTEEVQSTQLIEDTTEYTIIFDSNGGTDVSPITKLSGLEINQPDSPTKEGYFFSGWYSSLNFLSEYTFVSMPSQNITLYAKWIKAPYSLNYGIITGLHHTALITTDHRVFFWGRNNDGQIGNGTTLNVSNPVDITSEFNLNMNEVISNVYLGSKHSLAITSNGRVFTWGLNSDGQLGDGTTLNKNTPIDITSELNLLPGEKVIQAAIGLSNRSYVITTLGRVFAWGDNSSGQLGDGTTDVRLTPVEITHQFGLETNETIVQINVGGGNSSAISSLGRLFTWGVNNVGQLGDGTKISSTTPKDITSNFDLNTDEIIIQSSFGNSMASALTSSGRVFVWGRGDHGQLTVDSVYEMLYPTDVTSVFNLNNDEIVVQISMGLLHCALITSEGRMFTWGMNTSGEIGDGTTSIVALPQDITSMLNLNQDEKIVQISLGSSYTFAITSQGRIFSWGDNSFYQLGDGTTNSSSIPMDISSEFTFNQGETVRNQLLYS